MKETIQLLNQELNLLEHRNPELDQRIKMLEIHAETNQKESKKEDSKEVKWPMLGTR